MPVINHDVHPSTKVGAAFRYGCWNLPAALNHRMSDRCRYDMSDSDPNCTDCKHRGSGESYAQSIREQGA